MITQAGRPLVTRVVVARSLPARTLGFMGRRRPPSGGGMFFPRCRAIHTCFMRFALDVFFLDQSNRIVRHVDGLKPWRFTHGGRHADSTLEVPAGSLDLSSLDFQQPLCLVDDGPS